MKKKKGLDEEILSKSNIIVCVEHSIPLEELYSKEGEYVKVKSAINSTYKDGNRYINVYLKTKDVEDDSLTKYIYKFDDVVNIVLNDPYNFDGICMISDDVHTILDHCKIFNYKKNRVMAIADNMKELLFNLKEYEIEYIGKESYDVISYIYFKESSIPGASAFFGKDKEEISKLLNEGYHKLGQVVTCNY